MWQRTADSDNPHVRMLSTDSYVSQPQNKLEENKEVSMMARKRCFQSSSALPVLLQEYQLTPIFRQQLLNDLWYLSG